PPIYTLSLHDALPISELFPALEPRHDLALGEEAGDPWLDWQKALVAYGILEGERGERFFDLFVGVLGSPVKIPQWRDLGHPGLRSEEHTSELQSLRHL